MALFESQRGSQQGSVDATCLELFIQSLLRTVAASETPSVINTMPAAAGADYGGRAT
jgi:hypothetical protein